MKTISKYWKQLNYHSNRLLNEYGYENFKQHIGIIYNDDSYEDSITLWGKLTKVVPKEILTRFEEPLVGNPFKMVYNNKRVSRDLGVSIRDYWTLVNYIDFNNIKKMVEIGGGYGRMPYVITQLHPDNDYTMCDIEPSLGLAKWYLDQVAADAKISYIHPEDLSGSCDLVIANNCLHEMTVEQVGYYFNYVDKNAKYFYFNCWNDTTMPNDFIRWTKDDYPIRNKWEEIFKRDYIKENYFEALYKI